MLGPDKLLIYQQSSMRKVHAVPGQAQQLREAAAGEQGHGDQSLQTAALDGLEQRCGLFVAEWVNLRALCPGELTVRGRVAGICTPA